MIFPIYKYALRNGTYEDFINLAIFLREKRYYSFYNAALIYCQRRGVGWIETERGWKKHGRYLKPDAKPIVIMQAFSPINFVYDVEDTYGNDDYPPIQRLVYKPINTLERVNLSFIENVLRRNHIYFGKEHLGDRNDGFAQYLPDPIISVIPYNKSNKPPKKILQFYAVVVNETKSVTQQLLAIIHELGHIYCGHLPTFKGAQKYGFLSFSREVNEDISVEQAEFEAEAVVKFICDRLDVKYDNYTYLNGYKINGKIPKIDLNAVISATDKIWRILENAFIAPYYRLDNQF
ncbi:MAG: ImmA/IrrE family metallo-endopeptidase [Candidatus Coproplasma sp.]